MLRPVNRNLLDGVIRDLVRGIPVFGTGAAPAPGRLPPVALSPSIDFDRNETSSMYTPGARYSGIFPSSRRHGGEPGVKNKTDCGPAPLPVERT